jgi:hypothetical protein
MPEQFVSLETLGQGAAIELFSEELRKVLENVLDPNTKATATRSVTLKAFAANAQHVGNQFLSHDQLIGLHAVVT